MSAKKQSIKIVLVAVLVVSTVGAAPALATDDGGDAHNIVCDYNDGDGAEAQTGLGGLVAQLVTLIVTVSALIAVVGGAGFTLASAAKPTENYAERRNQTILYGGGTILVLYGANAIVSQFADSLDFGCILPFV